MGSIAYCLELPLNLSRIHDVFHVSLLKKYHLDPTHVLQPEDLEIDESLTYKEQPVQLLDREVKELRRKKIPLVKVLWRNYGVEKATWEMEKEIQKNYPDLFARLAENFENEILLKERGCDDLEKLFFSLPNYLHFYLNYIFYKICIHLVIYLLSDK